MRWRRIIPRVLAFLLLGAIVNVAVAWGCVLPLNPARYEGDWKLVDLGSDRYVRVDSRTRLGQAQIEREYGVGVLSHSPALLWPPPSWPRLELRAGWPSFALACTGFNDYQIMTIDGMIGWEVADRITQINGGIRVAGRSRASEPTCVILPLTPIWPGFAINTLFYAAILWLMVAAPFALRRRRRVKRGLCPACAYPVGTSDVCTECGRELRLGAGAGRREGDAHDDA